MRWDHNESLQNLEQKYIDGMFHRKPSEFTVRQNVYFESKQKNNGFTPQRPRPMNNVQKKWLESY